MTAFTCRWIDETGRDLTPAQYEAEQYESVTTVLTHDTCGGRVHIQSVGTSETAHCRRCGATWTQTFTAARSEQAGGWTQTDAGQLP